MRTEGIDSFLRMLDAEIACVVSDLDASPDKTLYTDADRRILLRFRQSVIEDLDQITRRIMIVLDKHETRIRNRE